MQQVTPVVEKFILGSGDVLVGATYGTIASMGAADGIKGEESFERVKIEIDNAGEVVEKIKNHKIKISGEFYELDLARVYAIRGGIDSYSTVDGTIVNNHSQVVASGAWSYDGFIPFEYQNGDGSKITPDSVTGSTDSTLTLGTDYFIGEQVDGSGIWGIVILDSETLSTETQTITIVFDYTPAASKVLSSGGKVTVADRVVVIRHKDSTGSVVFELQVYKAKNDSGLTLNFPSDNGDDALKVPFTFEGTCDSTRTVGDQLFKITDSRVY